MIALTLLPGTTLVLAMVYAVVSGIAARRLVWLDMLTEGNSPTSGLCCSVRVEHNTKKMFVVTCFAVTVLRFVSFASMTALNYHNFGLLPGGGTQEQQQGDDGDAASRHSKSLYDKLSIVLFDLPDFCCVSAYVLLLVVWAEAYLKSRRHWLSTSSYRRRWITSYFIFNAVLYTVQVGLCLLLLVPSIDTTWLTFWLYTTLTAFNLCLPVGWLLGFLYLTIMFSGFPMSSAAAEKRLATLSSVGVTWTLSRILWGAVMWSAVLQGWLLSLGGQSRTLYSLALVLLFLFAEVLPIWKALQETTIQSLAAAVRAQSVTFASADNILLQSITAASPAALTAVAVDGSGNGRTGAGVGSRRGQYDSLARADDFELGGIALEMAPVTPPPRSASSSRSLSRDRSPGKEGAAAARLIHTSAPGALAALRLQQGRQFVGRPLPSSSASPSEGASRARHHGLPRSSGALISINDDDSGEGEYDEEEEEEEWSGDEEAGETESPLGAGGLSRPSRYSPTRIINNFPPYQASYTSRRQLEAPEPSPPNSSLSASTLLSGEQGRRSWLSWGFSG